jgi:hypothetical protein
VNIRALVQFWCLAILIGSLPAAVLSQSQTTNPHLPPAPQSVSTNPGDDSEALSLGSANISDPKKSLPNSTATLIVTGTGLKNGDTTVVIFGTSYPVVEVSADGSSGKAEITLPSDYDPNKLYPVTIASMAMGITSAEVTLDTVTGGSVLPSAKDLAAQRKTWERQSKEMEAYIKAGQRYAIDLARLQAVQQQIRAAQQPRPQRPRPRPIPSAGGSGYQNKYCQPDSQQEASSIRIRRAVMDPKEASDAFGRRIGRRFLVYQVTIENKDKNYQYMVHDVSIDLSRLFNQPPGSYEWAFSTRELSLLRGVPEKGQDQDPRNLTFHVLRGIGTVAGGVSGLTAFTDVFGAATAAYNGPFLSSFIDVVPDHTATQLNRLSDSAFATNTVVGKQQAKAFAVFVPQSLFMTNEERKGYWKEPINILSSPTLDFRNADLCVDGTFVTEVITLTLRTIAFSDPSKAAANVTVVLKVTGAGISPGDTLNLFANTYQLKNVSSDGASAESDVALPATYDTKQQYPGTLSSGKTGQKTAPVNLPSPLSLTLTSITFADPTVAAPNVQVTLKLAGTNIVSADTVLNIFGASTQLQNVSTDGTVAQAVLTLPGNYDPKQSYPATLSSTKTGDKSKAANLQIANGLTLATVNFADAKLAKAGAPVTLKVAGKNLAQGDTVLNVFSGSSPLKNVSADGTTAEADVTLPTSYDPKQSYPATLTSAKSGEKTGVVNVPSAAAPSALTLTKISFADAKLAKAGAPVTLKVAGTNLAQGDTVLNVFSGSSPLKNVSADGTTAEANVTLPTSYDPKQSYPATLSSAKSGNKTAAMQLPRTK